MSKKLHNNPAGAGGQWSFRLREGAFIGLSVVCIYLFLALATYQPGDPGWSSTASHEVVRNAGGVTGAWLADVCYSLFGIMAFLFPVLLAYRTWLIFRRRDHSAGFDPWHTVVRVSGFCLIMAATTGLVHINGTAPDGLPAGAGGVLGHSIGEASTLAFNVTGARLLLVACLLFGATIFADISWLKTMDALGRITLQGVGFAGRQWQRRQQDQRDRKVQQASVQHRGEVLRQQVEKRKSRPAPRIEPVLPSFEKGKKVLQEKQVTLFPDMGEGALPPLGLLNQPDHSGPRGYSEKELADLSRRLELKLLDFNIEAEVVAVFPGPVITRFEIKPAAGTKVSKISGLAKDLARSLAVISVRIVEVIPGTPHVGVEIPNEHRQTVTLGEVLSSKAYEDARSPVTLALGHDISGLPVVADLARMPHLLIAGTTGAGKSVGVNAMLLSLLYKSGPDQVRMMLVDPKMLELSVYDGIPHLLTPVITDMKDAANGLRWCVGEMERRYKLMATLGVRNLAGYNKKVRDAVAAGEPLRDPLWSPDPMGRAFDEPVEPPLLEPLPFIVVVIDEFADMMMVVGKKVEELIARIAQKARAAGIHLILATQRPSVDVITGLIKANIPARIAFQVSSKVDSRTILDQGGAEQLLGQGDMLYLPPGTGIPIRVHGAFVADEEVHRVVGDWKRRAAPRYVEDLLNDGADQLVPGIGMGLDDDGDAESDALYDEAVDFVTRSRKASISAVQRKLRIGYNRAARMIEAMEAAGVVSEMQTNGQREVLAPPPAGD